VSEHSLFIHCVEIMYFFLINQILLVITCLPLFTLQQESAVYLITAGIEIEKKSNWTSYERVTGIV